ncbi:MAG: hypothetical protein N2234_08115 [Planctomycetota bacterium]|nr:hypothetical protein [Planctomycetota bacterium]
MPDSVLFIYTENPLRIPSEKIGSHRLSFRKGNIPAIPASFVKKALSEIISSENTPLSDNISSDAELLLLPVRSLTGGLLFAASCKGLENLKRSELFSFEIEPPQDGCALVCDTIPFFSETIPVEDILLKARKSADLSSLARRIADTALPPTEEYSIWREMVSQNIIVVSDTMMEYFVLRSLILSPRLAMNGKVEYEEYVPQDSLFVAFLDASALSVRDAGESVSKGVVFVGAGKRNGFGLSHIRMERRTE